MGHDKLASDKNAYGTQRHYSRPGVYARWEEDPFCGSRWDSSGLVVGRMRSPTYKWKVSPAVPKGDDIALPPYLEGICLIFGRVRNISACYVVMRSGDNVWIQNPIRSKCLPFTVKRSLPLMRIYM